MERFLNTTWSVWWLLAVAAVARWYWVNLGPGAQKNKNDRTPWKQLHWIAVQERDLRKILAPIEVAGAAILRRMNDQRDDENAGQTKALEHAKKNLARIAGKC